MKIHLVILFAFLLPSIGLAQKMQFNALTFSKTEGFRHESIEAGTNALKKLAAENFFKLDHTEDASLFTEDYLNNYDVIILLNTTGDIFNADQREAFKKFVQSGKGVVGVHSATDTEYDWPWYTELIGAQFESHPHIQTARVQTVHQHPSTYHLPKIWLWTDEWYNFKHFNDKVIVLLELDESSYESGKEEKRSHPISWYHDYDGGRVFYTGLGHDPRIYENPVFIRHLLGGIWYAAKKDMNVVSPVDGF
ncbi:ThuA domain-containing protein [Anditalea andensis]|uniref:Crp/Fnr family transcriptional regulator n=1 Tax=Anditalea andensis TaxID=1048983 RepID=A0A074KXP3_9BACT|nr:ThuA domain-containing protein [Anditalea andensis]KEO73709.1 Crp/Fnr family transcriptional regulator [Anditalea andensis]